MTEKTPRRKRFVRGALSRHQEKKAIPTKTVHIIDYTPWHDDRLKLWNLWGEPWMPVPDSMVWIEHVGFHMIQNADNAKQDIRQPLFAIECHSENLFLVTDGAAAYILDYDTIDNFVTYDRTTRKTLIALPEEGEVLRYYKNGAYEEYPTKISSLLAEHYVNNLAQLYPVPVATVVQPGTSIEDRSKSKLYITNVAHGLSFLPPNGYSIDITNVLYVQDLYLRGIGDDHTRLYYYSRPVHPEGDIGHDPTKQYMSAVFVEHKHREGVCAVIMPTIRDTAKAVMANYSKTYKDLAS